MLTKPVKTLIDGTTDRIYYKCSVCGEYKMVLSREGLEFGTAEVNDPALVAMILAGKVATVDRKCDRCYAASYTVYNPRD
jgi:hypothetical protein